MAPTFEAEESAPVGEPDRKAPVFVLNRDTAPHVRLLVTCYVNVGSKVWNLMLYEGDEIDELATRFVLHAFKNAHQQGAPATNEVRLRALANSLAYTLH